jgi:hypothetical protein
MSIVDMLNAQRATAETVLEIMHTSVSELSHDKTDVEMLAEMCNQASDEARFVELCARFKGDPVLVREAALAWLAVASDDPEKRDVVMNAAKDADRSAPLIEVGAIMIVALYAMYLIATGGIKESTRKIEQKADGTHVVTEMVVYHSFSEPVKSVVALFKAAAGVAVRKATEKS